VQRVSYAPALPPAPAGILKRRTLTNLYNARPTWLVDARRKLDEAVFAAYRWPSTLTDLDEAVFAAYRWPSTLTDTEILERLLALNHQRAAHNG